MLDPGGEVGGMARLTQRAFLKQALVQPVLVVEVLELPKRLQEVALVPDERAVQELMPALWVPIIHPCWSGSMPVLVKGAAEPVPSADIQLRDPLRTGNRIG